MLRRGGAVDELLGLAGSCETLSIRSEALRGNALGDANVRRLPIYLPPGHDTPPDGGYPTIYFLPSYGADARTVLAARPWEETLFQRVDRLISGGSISPLIVVAVDGWTRLGGSQYVDSLQNGAHARFVIDEVIAAVDAALPTRARPGARALLGKSSGGFGALHIAMRYPGRFGALAAHSADGYFRYSTVPAFAAAQRELQASDGSIEKFVERFEHAEKRTPAMFEAMVTLAYAAAYSPLSATPFDIALPFDRESGELVPEIFVDRWLAFDPVEEAGRPAVQQALRELKLCYLDCGDHDEYSLDVATRLVAKKLQTAKIPVMYESFAGGHRGGGARYDRSFVQLSNAIRDTP